VKEEERAKLLRVRSPSFHFLPIFLSFSFSSSFFFWFRVPCSLPPSKSTMFCKRFLVTLALTALVCGGKAVRAQVRGHGQREGEEEEREGENSKAAIVASSSFFLSVSS
jgi:hypothetical protein